MGGGGHCDDNDGGGGGEKIYVDILNDWRIIRKDFEGEKCFSNIKLSYQIRFNFREVKAKLTRMKAQSRKTFKVFEKKINKCLFVPILKMLPPKK